MLSVTAVVLLGVSLGLADNIRNIVTAHRHSVIDLTLPALGMDLIPLHDIFFDVEYKRTAFSGYVPFHLQNGTLGNLSETVQRIEACEGSFVQALDSHYLYIECSRMLYGLVATYDLKVIADYLSIRGVAEVSVEDAFIIVTLRSLLNGCTKCTDVGHFSAWSHCKLKLLRTPMDFPRDIMKKFEEEINSRVEREIEHFLNTTYRQAIADKVAAMKVTDWTGQDLQALQTLLEREF